MWARSTLYHWITYKVWISWEKEGSHYTVWPWMYHVVGTSPALGSSLGCLCFLLCIYFLWIKPLSLERGGCLLKTQKVDTTHKFQEASETCWIHTAPPQSHVSSTNSREETLIYWAVLSCAGRANNSDWMNHHAWQSQLFSDAVAFELLMFL